MLPRNKLAVRGYYIGVLIPTSVQPIEFSQLASTDYSQLHIFVISPKVSIDMILYRYITLHPHINEYVNNVLSIMI